MSRYDVLAKRVSPQLAVEPGEGTFSAAARRGNPSYRQFSAYIPADLYKRLKMRLAEQEVELSQAVEQAIGEWLAKESKSLE